MRKCIERREEREEAEELLRHQAESNLTPLSDCSSEKTMIPSKMQGQAFHALQELLSASRIHCIIPVLLIDKHHRVDKYCFNYDFCLNYDKKM